MNIDDKIKYWLDIAEYDLITADAMYSTKRYLYVGFMCHQIIESLLKYLNDDKCKNLIQQTKEFFEWIKLML